MTSARQIYLGSRRGPALPYDAEVEYIESTGTQWIDTGIVAQNGLTVEIDIYHNSGNQWLFGGRTAYRSNSFGLYQSTASRKLIHFGNNDADINSPPARHIYRLQSNVFYIDGNIAATLPADSFVGDSAVYLFNLHLLSTPNDVSLIGVTGKMYYAKVWLGSDLIHNFIPVRFTNEQGVSEGAMYDRTSGQLFHNSGTGVFGFGTDIAGGGYKWLGYSPLRFSRFSRLWKEAA